MAGMIGSVVGQVAAAKGAESLLGDAGGGGEQSQGVGPPQGFAQQGQDLSSEIRTGLLGDLNTQANDARRQAYLDAGLVYDENTPDMFQGRQQPIDLTQSNLGMNSFIDFNAYKG